MADILISLDNIRKMSAILCLLILSVKVIYIFYGFGTAKLIKLARMAGVMYEAGHAYSIQSTW